MEKTRCMNVQCAIAHTRHTTQQPNVCGFDFCRISNVIEMKCENKLAERRVRVHRTVGVCWWCFHHTQNSIAILFFFYFCCASPVSEIKHSKCDWNCVEIECNGLVMVMVRVEMNVFALKWSATQISGIGRNAWRTRHCMQLQRWNIPARRVMCGYAINIINSCQWFGVHSLRLSTTTIRNWKCLSNAPEGAHILIAHCFDQR